MSGLRPTVSVTARLWLLGGLSAVLFLLMASHASPLQPTVVELQFTYDRAAFLRIVSTWPADGLARFKAHFALDFPFLVAYGSFGYLLPRHTSLLRPLPAALRPLLAWSLPLAAGLDALENGLHLALIADVAAAPDALFLLAGGVATAKWLLIAAFLLGTALALLLRRFRRSAATTDSASAQEKAPPQRGSSQ